MKQTIKKEEYLFNTINDLRLYTLNQVCALKSLQETVTPKFSTMESDLVELTLSSCNNMKKLIDIVIKVYKLNYEKLTLNYDKFKMSELLKEVLDETMILIKYNQLEPEIIIENDDYINADKTQIKCVVENILLNSINNAFKNTKMQIKIFKDKSRRIFEIKTKAPHIEPEVIKEMFNKYKHHHSAYSRTCIGLGLYLSKEIIIAHFGNMIINSSLNNINTFGFCLPDN